MLHAHHLNILPLHVWVKGIVPNRFSSVLSGAYCRYHSHQHGTIPGKVLNVFDDAGPERQPLLEISGLLEYASSLLEK
ncbi:MAG: hypothetical protein ABIQ79_04205 [Nitrospiraceae bacterium]